MKLYVILALFLVSCVPKPTKVNDDSSSELIIRKVNTVEEITNVMDLNSDTLYVVNFWATWCKPCVEEMPYFVSLSEDLASEAYKFIFVSLDFPKQHESKLIPFVKKEMQNMEVVHMMNSDYNSWLAEVGKEWSGSIPATWAIKGSREEFIEGSFHSKAELKEFIEKLD